MVDSPHGKGVTFTIRSAPVGYAAEYLTCGSLVAIPMGFSLLMSMQYIIPYLVTYWLPPVYSVNTASAVLTDRVQSSFHRSGTLTVHVI